MVVQTSVVAKVRLPYIWRTLEEGFAVYQAKSPHQLAGAPDILEFLQAPDSDEVLVATVDGDYAGFLTFKVQEIDGERWGTISVIYMNEEAQRLNVLPVVCEQLEGLLRSRGCNVMNYMTARKGFRRLAPSLGFRPRIIEWMKEL